jgi:hypothetical protein
MKCFFLLMLKVKKHHNLVYKIIYNSINIFHKNYQWIHLHNNKKKKTSVNDMVINFDMIINSNYQVVVTHVKKL